ncbi:ATP-binding protein [Ruminococcus albus]|uniref:AAA family ATPase n=1 Tax=Ruminococcus albus (strain ATCC 27210 / DSM 20455 / JCM 14654 / NCDO 2250 / 7) TaxID=697329 RepID=E6UJH6_RUMA7|nr:ATP-binding protein [Ruminococcus albus]ADU23822.1 AAA family ATPase [Ruminococcus albus 7 = DSM 20455]
MLNRIAQKALLRLAEQFPIVGITGPRQSGKSTLTKITFPDKKYVTFDDKNMRELAKSNPADFIMAFPNGAVIDEAQKVPEIFDALKLHVDSAPFTPGKFILTGSSQFRLRKNMSDSLAGRAAFLKLLPFSIKELKDADLLPKNAYDLIFVGQYPPLFDSEKHYIAEDWFESYIDTYLDLDVKDQINESNLSTFRKFIQICAIYSGQLLSMDSIAKQIGISQPTVKSWLSILENSYIIHLLEPDTNNLGRSIVKTPKLYFVDSGLLCHLLRLESKEDLLLSKYKGAVVETCAVAEMLKNRMNQAKKPNLTFYRDSNGFEVDTIADWKHTFAVEIKSSSDAEAKLSANTKKYLTLRNDDNAHNAVFYLGDISMTINDTMYVSWKDWGDHLN